MVVNLFWASKNPKTQRAGTYSQSGTACMHIIRVPTFYKQIIGKYMQNIEKKKIIINQILRVSNSTSPHIVNEKYYYKT